jgi:hypothetical protein
LHDVKAPIPGAGHPTCRHPLLSIKYILATHRAETMIMAMV